ncbi:hypothetical protein EDB80DRAFT_693950 [Ilyonectria destructans]|nr:hypothetical protein EDB80DRAFT_693950 [Ilyonectria destructans]
MAHLVEMDYVMKPDDTLLIRDILLLSWSDICTIHNYFLVLEPVPGLQHVVERLGLSGAARILEMTSAF